VVHFVLPFAVLFIMVIHLLFLHRSGRTNALYTHTPVEKIPFYPYFIVKDRINVVLYLVVFLVMLLYPYSLGEPELYIEANPLNSPLHIVPEFYFLAFYALLRCVPSKRVGLILMLIGLLVYFVYPYMVRYVRPPTERLKVWRFYYASHFVLLSYLGGCPLRSPYLVVAAVFSFLFFMRHALLGFV